MTSFEFKFSNSVVHNLIYALEERHYKAKNILDNAHKTKNGKVGRKVVCDKCGQRIEKVIDLEHDSWLKSQKSYVSSLASALKQLRKSIAEDFKEGKKIKV